MGSKPQGRRYGSLIVPFMLLAAGCGQRTTASGVVMEYQISPQRPKPGPVSLTLRLADQSHAPLTGAHLKVEGDMSHPGMAPVFGEATETAPGRYESRLNLNMAGDWVILVHGTLADGERLEREVSVPGVRPE